MYPKISINDVTIRHAPYAERFKIARQAGFSGVEIWMDEAREYAKDHGGLESVATLLSENNLRLDQVLLLRDALSPNHAKDRKNYLKDAEQIFRDTTILGGKTVVACATFGTTDVDEAVGLFAELCDLAGVYDIRLALEFIGWAETIKDIKTAKYIIEKAGRKNGGILYDTLHHFFGGTTMKDLEDVPTDYLFAVHIVDVKRLDMPILEISREHRLFPGKGEVPIQEILDILHSKKYNSTMALEMFSNDYWNRPPMDVAKEGFQSMLQMISKAGFK